ncbi:single-stranded DNA-binding protein [Nocardioides pacificus]
MNDTYITFQGWVGSDVTLTEIGGGVQVASFRVGNTPRRFRGGQWENGETAWHTVKAWRSLASHVEGSVRNGDPVIVHGRLEADVWQREDGQTSTRYVVVATSVGHDLAKGTSTFAKASRQELTPAVDQSPVREVIHSYDEGGPNLDAHGEVVTPPAARPAA